MVYYEDTSVSSGELMSKLKTLFWDIETSHDIVATFGLYQDSVPHSNIIQNWFIISGSWKWEGEDKIHNTKSLVNKENFADDKEIVRKLADIVNKADIIVHHNGDKFDLKKLNTRLIFHRLPPLKNNPLTVDTLKAAKKHFSFTSNRLDYLGIFLGVGKKVETPKGLWMDVLKGNKKALNTMIGYNDGDVVLQEAVFNVLKPYIDLPLVDKNYCGTICNHCQSPQIQFRGYLLTKAGVKYKRFQCQDCGAWGQLRKREK